MTNPFLDRVRAIVHCPWFPAAGLAALCLFAFGDVLLGLRPGILSAADGDTARQFLYWREFGFSNLRHGHVPLWDPHIYCGVPFFGGWQAGLFYPPNWIYLILPLKLAIAVDAAMSTYIAGLLTAILARRQGFHPVAVMLTGAVVMFSGAFFAHVWPGHLSALAAMAWTPLALLAADEAIDRPSVRASLVGAFALAMQILAGHPQTVYNTALTVAIYAVIRLVGASSRARAIASLCAMPVAASLLTAVQLLTGVQASSEGVRSGAASFKFVSQYSFPPENLLTTIAPLTLGDLTHVMYWGRWEYWEAAGFIGIAALTMAIAGWRFVRSPRRGLWTTMSLALIVMALGKYTPLLHLLYLTVPGIAKFRAHDRFFYEATIFIALLSGAGLDALLRGATLKRGWAWATAILGALLFAAACAMRTDMGAEVIVFVRGHGDLTYLLGGANIPAFLAAAQGAASQALVIAGCFAIAVSAIIALLSRSRRWVYALAAVALLEGLFFARSMITTFDPAQSLPPSLAAWRHDHPGDFRVLQTAYPVDCAISLNDYDIWGYDPVVQRRYTELITAAEGENPDDASMFMRSAPPAVLMRLLRCQYVLKVEHGRRIVYAIPNPLPHGLVVYKAIVAPKRDEAFRVLFNPAFTGRDAVVLERAPAIEPGLPDAHSAVTVRQTSTDSLRIDAVTSSPGILLITDAYSRFWTAAALPGSAQTRYDVQSGNYAQIAIPVEAGSHHFTLNYCPPAFRLGAIISMVSLCAFLIVAIIAYRNNKDVID
ncbi:MAG: hypothetical protein P4L33_05275 [Capsulimonadaceae bacterium]|nr:hypothetical protein [Capsulimonadaceae bacterium]